MKKTYLTPEIVVVQLQHQGLLMESVQGNAGVNYRGAGHGDTRTKEQVNVWDEDW